MRKRYQDPLDQSEHSRLLGTLVAENRLALKKTPVVSLTIKTFDATSLPAARSRTSKPSSAYLSPDKLDLIREFTIPHPLVGGGIQERSYSRDMGPTGREEVEAAKNVAPSNILSLNYPLDRPCSGRQKLLRNLKLRLVEMLE